MKKKYMWLAAAFAALVMLAQPALAENKQEADIKMAQAALALDKFMQQGDADSARYLMKRSKAVIVIPNLIKAGFIISGNVGTGVITVKQKNGKWSAPVFMDMAGGGVGLQIGAQAQDLFLMVITDKGVQGVLHNKFKLGVGASIATGPVGRHSEASISAMDLHADVYSYSASQGLYAGAAITGDGMGLDDVTTHAYYETSQTSLELLKKPAGKLPDSARRFLDMVEKFSK